MASKHSKRERARVKITQAYIRSIKPTGKRQKVYDATVSGLILRVSPDAKSLVWAFDYFTKDHRRGLFTIGAAKDWPLTEVKAKARTLAGIVAQGGDPHADKIAEKQKRLDEQRAKLAAKGRTLRAYLYGDYYEHYLSEHRAGKDTQQRITAAWSPFMDVDMAALTVDAVTAHRRKRATAGVKTTTLNRDRTALLSMLNEAVRRNVIESNPLQRFSAMAVEDDKRVRYLGDTDDSTGERGAFMTALKEQPLHFQTIVRLALFTGMRRREILELKWRDVSLKQTHITVRAFTAKTAKTRHIPIPPAAVTLLQNWKAQSNITSIDGLVFPNPKTGKAYTTLQKRWQLLVDEAGIEDFTFRDCRHDYASRLALAGVDLYVIKELLGHSSIEMTQIYAHLSKAKKQSAVAVLG